MNAELEAARAMAVAMDRVYGIKPRDNAKPAPAPDPLIELRLTRLQILAVLSALAYYDESERPYIGGQWIHLPSRIEMQRVAAELAARANAEPSRVGCHVIGDAE